MLCTNTWVARYPYWDAVFLFFGVLSDLNCALRAIGEAESSSHIRLSDRCPLARLRERRDIFAIGEYLGGSLSLLGCRFSFLWGAIRFELRSASHRRSRIQFTYPARRSTSLLVRRRARVSSCFARISGWHLQKKESESLTCSLFSTKSVLMDGINPTIVG